MASSNPFDADWVSVKDEEHLDVRELKSQIYDLKQKLSNCSSSGEEGDSS